LENKNGKEELVKIDGSFSPLTGHSCILIY